MPPLELIAIICTALFAGAFAVLGLELLRAPTIKEDTDDDME